MSGIPSKNAVNPVISELDSKRPGKASSFANDTSSKTAKAVNMPVVPAARKRIEGDYPRTNAKPDGRNIKMEWKLGSIPYRA